MNQDKIKKLRDYQSESFIEKTKNFSKRIKLNQVFTNTQIRTKLYGLEVNGIRYLALTCNEKKLALDDLSSLENVITEFKQELK